MRIQKKTGLVVCNPLLIGVVLTIGVLLLFRIPYEAYDQGAEFISLFSPRHRLPGRGNLRQAPLLRRNWLPILVGCTVGSVVSMGSVLLLCRLFGLDEAMTASLLPKSVTTPSPSACPRPTAASAPSPWWRWCSPASSAPSPPRCSSGCSGSGALAAGLAIGACSHAVGTSRALELGETEGP